MVRPIAAVVLVLAVVSPAAWSQPESDNVVHTRHQHPHNPKHATDRDASRFFTDRVSEIELPLPSEEDAFVFAIFGDRTGGPDSGINILADAVRDLNLFEPDMVMTVGDLIQGYNETPGWLAQMREYKAVMSNLICPWFPVAGNHDVYWRDETGMTRPPNEHEGRYEMHFGPLWYSFEHKNSHFIVLYTDEGNPETGERTFRKPEAQRMSAAQKAFLARALDRARGADHVFVFVHHPRWLGDNYGDDWESVHEMLVDAGNVTAVFAGHIHMMRSDGPRDGIEYLTLATVGGHQWGAVPDAGFLHQYHIVTVRKNQVAMASVPVGEVQDPRDITGELALAANDLAGSGPELAGALQVERNGSARGLVEMELVNPTGYAMDYTLTLGSEDNRWSTRPDHMHGTLAPGARRGVSVLVERPGAGLDRYFGRPEIRLDREILTDSFRYAIPTLSTPIELVPVLDEPTPSTAHESVLDVRDAVAATVRSRHLRVPDGAMTLECWFNARRYDRRTGLATKTEDSGFGLFVSRGRAQFSIFLGDAYTTLRSEDAILKTDTWHHIAGVYDGEEVRLYVDGELVAHEHAHGERRTNDLPFIIGADVDARGEPTSYFDGFIDEVRISRRARYEGDRFEPVRRFSADPDTAALYHMDPSATPWIFDASLNRAHAWIGRGPEIVGAP